MKQGLLIKERGLLLIKSVLIFILTISIFTNLTSCESEEASAIARGQKCIDKNPTQDGARDCLTHLSNDYQSLLANEIRCILLLISGGITTDRLLSSIESGFSSDTSNFIGKMFLDDIDTAKKAKESCDKTENRHLKALSFAAFISTHMVKLGGGEDPSVFLKNCSKTPGRCDDIAIGNAILDFQNTCSENNGKKELDQSLCEGVRQAAEQDKDPGRVAQRFYGILKK